jgi:hypothetical protein
MKKVFFAPHLGLGDHFTCNGMTREIYKESSIMVMIVKENNIKVVRRMFSDLKNLHLIPLVGSMDYDDDQHMNDAFYLMKFFESRGYEIKSVGAFSPNNFIRDHRRYDEIFYNQVNVDFQKRWDSFYYERDINAEMKMFNECFNLKKNEYIFLHDDPTRGRVINKELLPNDLRIITPHQKFWDADILDYRYILENAKEIHCVNSSFADLMDSFDLSKVNRLCIHEYARTEDPVNYKNNFEIIKNY